MSIEKVKGIVSKVKPEEPKRPSLAGLQRALAGLTTDDIGTLKHIPTIELQTIWLAGYNEIHAHLHQLRLDQAVKLQREKIAAHDIAEKGKYSGTPKPASAKEVTRRAPRRRGGGTPR